MSVLKLGIISSGLDKTCHEIREVDCARTFAHGVALYLTLISPTASACSLAQMPDWLNFVLSRGLANLNPDCTLTWKGGEVTDLNGNLVGPLPYAFLQQFGVIFFFVGFILAVIGIYLTVKYRSLNAKSRSTSSTG